ncbi:hypothetical protein [Sphingomonas aquatilis]|uniref:hypothetical protein n=1 Tax=Sphingomonas aquatilis TaxID=93063 RepID=UPI0023F9A683|nr:hypothetical protein [Sphingomonas aquatilis]MCI4653142.1 hypothetical protein [Sphingomonas aquatilis]
MTDADLRGMTSRDLGMAYLAAQLACEVHDLEREMHRRGEFSAEDWRLTLARWPRDFALCRRACHGGHCDRR